jgi:hypothetical protein
VTRPREAESDSYPGLVYVQQADPAVESYVEDRISMFARSLSAASNVPEHVTIHVAFFEKHIRKGLFGKSEEKLVFEEWVVPVQLVAAPSQMASASQMRTCMSDIVRMSDSKKDHLPPLDAADKEHGPYPFEISMPGFETNAMQQSSSDLSFFKRLVRS